MDEAERARLEQKAKDEAQEQRLRSLEDRIAEVEKTLKKLQSK